MRRDICHYYPVHIQNVYDAYTRAARERFNKKTDYSPYNSITFGLNFSMRYNMNGGACTVRFKQYKEGTAVNVRITVAQLIGARYTLFDQDLTDFVEEVLGVKSEPLQLSVDWFMTPDAPQQISAPQPQTIPQPVSQSQPIPQPQIYTQPQAYAQPQPQTIPQPEPAPQPAHVPENTAEPNERIFFCVKCGTPCSVPAGLGPIIITCPTCSNQFGVTS